MSLNRRRRLLRWKGGRFSNNAAIAESGGRGNQREFALQALIQPVRQMPALHEIVARRRDVKLGRKQRDLRREIISTAIAHIDFNE